jgi:hypothetical protein
LIANNTDTHINLHINQGKKIMFKASYNLNASPYEESDCIRYQFLEENHNTICVSEKYIIDISLLEMVKITRNWIETQTTINNFSYDGFDEKTILLQGEGIQIFFTKGDARTTQARHGIVQLSITGHPHIVEPLLDFFDKRYQTHQQGQLELWYKGKNGPTYMNVLLNPFGTFHGEFYPWLPENFMDEYMNSTASVLFVKGEPGTGKTSILRDLICSRGLYASATYDESILNCDEMFLNFITSDKTNLIIIEDADNILSPRESSKNPLMSRFLNFSEGLAKFPSKKIIFTTNLHDFNNIDEALTRSGRCFGILKARKLSFEEAVIAAKIASVPVPEIEKEYSLADLLNQDQKYRIKHKNVGFTSSHIRGRIIQHHDNDL